MAEKRIREQADSLGPAGALVLASASPRRRQLLALLGLPFQVVAAIVDETVRPTESSHQLARRLAASKALAASGARTERLVLAADSVVVLDGQILGKPADRHEARKMLRALRGRSHRVVSGLALATDGRLVWHAAVESVVEMRGYEDAELERYVASGRPLDKAGAYGVQDPDFRPAARVNGCYPNVVGLPLCEVARGLRALGLGPTGPSNEALAPPCPLCERARNASLPS
ncbi:MAG TPA: Maf family protein [Chloroflexota bacterium]|nr:Maf family protein [Chloroflexota bacterium]